MVPNTAANETTSDWINGGFGIVLSGGAGLLARGTQVAGQVASKGDEIATAVGAVADDGANAGATALNTAANSKAQFSHIDFGREYLLLPRHHKSNTRTGIQI